MSDQINTETTTEKLARIRQAIEAGHFVAKADLRWLLEEASTQASRIAELEHHQKTLSERMQAAAKTEMKLRQALTLWLAIRGSNSEEFFKATAGLAAQTAQALNE